MNEREKTIRLWFDMWLNQQDMGIDDIFTSISTQFKTNSLFLL
jgi:hypothetical protein